MSSSEPEGFDNYYKVFANAVRDEGREHRVSREFGQMIRSTFECVCAEAGSGGYREYQHGCDRAAEPGRGSARLFQG